MWRPHPQKPCLRYPFAKGPLGHLQEKIPLVPHLVLSCLSRMSCAASIRTYSFFLFLFWRKPQKQTTATASPLERCDVACGQKEPLDQEAPGRILRGWFWMSRQREPADSLRRPATHLWCRALHPLSLPLLPLRSFLHRS